MVKNVLILVSGLPATGKTTLSKRISEEFDIPLASVDAIKETIWDTLGHDFVFEFNDKIARTSFELLFYFIEASLLRGGSVVVEGHFNPERNNQRFNELKKKFGANLLQIYCDCETEALRKRFKERTKKDSYHAGHKHTIELYGEERILNSLGNKNKRLEIDGATYELDTTNPEKIDYEKLFGFIRDNV
ncbi:MAG: AAA family ATPase [Candidatus Moraniibacteriota bacterium]